MAPLSNDINCIDVKFCILEKIQKSLN